MPDPDSLSKFVEPLVFDTYCRPQVWGGRLLGELLGRTLPGDGPYGESWDLCTQKLHVSRVVQGRHEGRDLGELWSQFGKELSGSDRKEPFPLLLKWLECRELLSVQVHPGDEMAQRVLNEPYGKSEAWVVVFAEPTARIYAGLKPGVTQETFLAQLKAGTLETCLHSFVPKAGDCISIPAGTVHAAGGGIVIAEVQQSSDATFRLYDWNRMGLDGKPRPLQIDLAMEAIDWQQGPVVPVVPAPLTCGSEGINAELLVDGHGFRMERHTVHKASPVPYTGELTIWMVLEGSAVLSHNGDSSEKPYGQGATIVVPASATEAYWKPEIPIQPPRLLCVRLR